MSLKDIEKLKEKLEKDPNSRLFVPLAEEYRKEGMLDEAVNVLLNGLELQPGYTTAKVSLGKIYYEKGMLDEARAAFEDVIKTVPDNLYAYKKLAEIYRDTGEKELAIKSFKTVLKLNPMDEDAFNQLSSIENAGVAAGVPDEMPSAESIEPEEEGGWEEEAVQEVLPEGATEPEIIQEPAHDEEELASFKDSLFGLKSEPPEALEDALTADESIDVFDEPIDAVEEEISFGDFDEPMEQGTAESQEVEADFSEEGFAGDISGPDSLTGLVSEEPSQGPQSLEDADRYIASGNYLEAMTIFKNLLSSNPDDRKALQRVEELRALLKLLGKDRELLISRLNDFLEGLMKGRDEFLGRS